MTVRKEIDKLKNSAHLFLFFSLRNMMYKVRTNSPKIVIYIQHISLIFYENHFSF